MARAETRTWLPLDRFAERIGISPLHFNQLTVTKHPSSATCGGVWFQHPWQDSDKVSREDVARAIHDAETMIARYLGYSLIPDWIVEEVRRTTRPAAPELWAAWGNVRGARKSIDLAWGYFVSGGRKAKTLVQAGVVPVRTDADGDAYLELVTLTVPTTVTDPCELRVYYPGHAGADEWEVRPIKVAIAGGVATITFKSWLIVDTEPQEILDPKAIDGDAVANYLATVDVYRVYNDPQSQAMLAWEQDGNSCGCGSLTCGECTYAAQVGCLATRTPRLSIVTYGPATWDAEAGAFGSAQLAVGRDPDRVIASYLAGWRDTALACPMTTMELELERAVVYLAASLLDRPVCTCNNVKAYVGELQVDLALNAADTSYQVTPAQLENHFGTRKGAVQAWGICQQDGRRVARTNYA